MQQIYRDGADELRSVVQLDGRTALAVSQQWRPPGVLSHRGLGEVFFQRFATVVRGTQQKKVSYRVAG